MSNRPGNDDRLTATNGSRDGSDASRDTRQNGGQQGGSSRSRSNRGFASMDREKQREIASKGGRAAHAKGTAHEFDSGEAREAGRKGGMAVSRNRDHMAAIGRRGGEARGQSRGRGVGQVNSGADGGNMEGGFQNSRGGAGASSNGLNGDRQVAIDNQSDDVTSNTQGTRGGNNSLGGERRPQGGDASSRNESFGR
jgi:general stress protein YciG